MSDFIQKLVLHFEKNSLPQPPERILVAVSGGPDSIALAHALHELNYSIAIAHCNFQLRSEAEEEAHFVRQFAQKIEVPFFKKEFNTSEIALKAKESIQLTARKLRYKWFDELAQEKGYNYCATAHHLDDQLETLLYTLFRGKSTKLLKGIPSKRDSYIRPFLSHTKEEIYTYIGQHKLEYKTDRSNLSLTYTRNKIRHQLIPLLQNLSPGWDKILQEKYNKQISQHRLLSGLIRKHKNYILTQDGSGQKINLKVIQETFGENHLETALAFILEEMGFHGQQIETINQLLASSSGKKVALNEKIILKDRNQLLIVPVNDVDNDNLIEIDSLESLPGPIYWNKTKITFSIIPPPEKLKLTNSKHLLDLNQLKFPLKIRSWRAGDRIQPLGMKGIKKVSDVLIEQKKSLFEKESSIILEDAKQIVCILDYRIAETVKITPESTQVLQIEWCKTYE